MTTSLEGIAARVADHVARATGKSVTANGVRPLIGGACQENFQLDLQVGGEARRMVLRQDAPSSIAGSLDRRREAAVITAAVAAGVRTPAAQWLHRQEPGAERWAYLMDFMPGVAIGRAVVRSPKLAGARERMVEQLAGELARIHSIRPETHPDLPIGALGAPFTGDPVQCALDGVRAMMGELVEPHPALELALAWLDHHRPTSYDVSLVHGDFRTGNFLVTPDGLSALLDWEFAHWGAPEEDIAWLCVRDWRFGQLQAPIGGFAQRAPFYAAYERASGRTVRPEAVNYWEVFGNVRWAAGCIYQGERYLSGKQTDIELIAIARRSAEMEWEALRLIENRP